MESKKQYHNRMVKEALKLQSNCKHDYTFSIFNELVCRCGLTITEKDLMN
jgi:hypothetical protein